VNGGAAASLWKSSRPDKTATVIRKIFQIILWLAAGAYVIVGVLAITGVLGSAREADSLGRAYAVFGSMILMIGAVAVARRFY
jgi:drug/metabolite transporter superfamily protein YnfA